MKIAVKDGKILIKEADATQMAIMKSWNKLKWNKSIQMMIGECDLEILQRLSTIVRLPASIDAIRKNMESVQEAVDTERVREKPKPLVHYPVKKSLYEHQVRAANMALLTFGMVTPEEEAQAYEEK